MSEHVDFLTENRMLAEVRRLRDDLNELKTQQFMSGRSGVQAYYSQTAVGHWDATGTVGTDADVGALNTNIKLRWFGDGSQDVSWALIGYKVFVNGLDAAHEISALDPTWTDGTRTATLSPGPNVSGSLSSYAEVSLDLATFKAVTYYVKAFVYSTAPGFSIDSVVT